jgi:hypothetical protein
VANSRQITTGQVVTNIDHPEELPNNSDNYIHLLARIHTARADDPAEMATRRLSRFFGGCGEKKPRAQRRPTKMRAAPAVSARKIAIFIGPFSQPDGACVTTPFPTPAALGESAT